jgi:hypothetical protein
VVSQPSSQAVVIGSNVTFTVVAAGAAPLAYQWLYNGVNIPGANSASLTLTNVQFSAAGQYSVSISNIVDSATSASATLAVLALDNRLLQIPDFSGVLGNTVDIPVRLTAQGNENALSFSISFPPSLLTYAGVQLGSGAQAAVLNVNDSQAASGRLGLGLALSADTAFPAGTQDIAVITFNVASAVGNSTGFVAFGDPPLVREVSDTLANDLLASYLGGKFTIGGGGYEGDVTPVPNGNGSVTVTDWIKIGRYAAQLDPVLSPGEFQRADCAPRSALGNGAITTTDWVQAGRYAAGLDPLTPAGGPRASSGGFAPKSALGASGPKSGSSRTLYVPRVGLKIGQTNRIPVLLVAQGNESAAGFSVNFDPSLLTFLSASAGSNAASAVLNANTSQATNGQVGIVLSLPIGTNTFAAGTQEIAALRFVVSSNATGITPMTLGDRPAAREISDSLANSLSASYSDTVLPFAPPLKIAHSGAANVLSWPTWANNGFLEGAGTLSSGAIWQAPSATATNVVSGEIRVTVPAAPGQTFFRLRLP